MIKRIAVDLNKASYNPNLLEFAVSMASKTDGTILGLVTIDVGRIEKSIGSVPLGGMYYAEKNIEFRVKEAEEKANLTLKEFQQFCTTRKVKHRSILRREDPLVSFTEEGKTADVIVTGVRAYGSVKRRKDYDTLNKLLKVSSCPILAIPEGFVPFKQVLVAYDGSPASSKALKAYAQLAGCFPDVERLIVINVNDEEETGREIVAPALDYLEAYGFCPEVYVLDGDPKEVIHKKAREMQAPLIVLGSFGESFIKDLIWGSTTSYFIEAEKFPLLIYY
ncbi:MAG: universal stress protein [Syntrophomonadaceae bacterium]|nr:universal stress protein [Syntrophomonadaceae bacterium]